MNCKYCDSSNVTKSEKFNGRQKYHCQDCKRKFTEMDFNAKSKPTSPELASDPLVDRQSTFASFGYYPENLSPKNSNRIVVLCPRCSKSRSIQRATYSPGRTCLSCRSTVKQLVGISASRKLYPSRMAKQYAYQKRKLATAEGGIAQRVRNLLRVSFNRVEGGYKTKGGLRHVGYTAKELHDRIASEMKKGCCVCSCPITDDWDIAHLKPVGKATSIQEVIDLFHLSNLSVAHVSCNRRLGCKDV